MYPTHINYSADKTADALIMTGSGNLYSLWLTLDGANDVTILAHDSVDNSGANLFPSITISAGDLLHNTIVIPFDPPISYTTGLYIDITTAGTVTYKAYYNTEHI